MVEFARIYIKKKFEDYLGILVFSKFEE